MEALNDEWIDKKAVEKLDEMDKKLIDTLKITFMSRKGIQI